MSAGPCDTHPEPRSSAPGQSPARTAAVSQRTLVMLPDYRPDNPYQELLARSLETQGWNVRFPAGYRRVLPLYRAVRSCPGASVLHLHWTRPYLKGDNRTVFCIYLVKLMIDLSLIRLSGVRVVWTLHNLIPHDARFPKLELWSRRLLCRLASTVIVHGAAGQQRATVSLRCPAKHVKVIPHGHYRETYGPPIPCRAARLKLDLPLDRRVFLFFGMIRPYKGVEQLLQTWRVLAPSNALLLIAGKCAEPRFAGEIARLAAEAPDVRFINATIPAEEVPHYFSAADVVVLPFAQVQTSGSLILAMSYGKPVIAASLGEIPETLRGADDLLFPAGDADSLRHMIEQAQHADLPDLERRTRVACDRLDWGRIGAATAQAYLAP